MTTRVPALAAGAIVTAVAIAACSGATNTTGSTATVATGTVAASTDVPETPPATRHVVTQPPATSGAAPAAAIAIPAETDPADHGAAALAVTITIAISDTETDTSPTDALHRAAPWIDPHLLASMLSAPASNSGTWLDLVAHHGYTSVTAQLANEYGQPADTAATAYETVSYTVRTLLRDHRCPDPSGWRTANAPIPHPHRMESERLPAMKRRPTEKIAHRTVGAPTPGNALTALGSFACQPYKDAVPHVPMVNRESWCRPGWLRTCVTRFGLPPMPLASPWAPTSLPSSTETMSMRTVARSGCLRRRPTHSRSCH